MKIKERELARQVRDFMKVQKGRIAYQTAILALANNTLLVPPPGIPENQSLENVRGIINEWKTKEEMNKKRITDETDKIETREKKKRLKFKKTLKQLLEITTEEKGESWQKYQQQLLKLQEIQKKIGKTKFSEIINYIKSCLVTEEARHSLSYLQFLYEHYLAMEQKIDEQIKERVRNHPVWSRWLCYVKGVDLHLAALVIGGFASAFKENEGIEHFKTVGQMNAFSGLHVVNGKAPRKVANEKLSWNNKLRSVLLGRLGKSLNQVKGDYYGLYRQRRKVEEEKKVSHIHRRALRWMVKIFVSHLYEEWRKAYNLPVRQAYAIQILGHTDNIEPIRDRIKPKIYRPM